MASTSIVRPPAPIFTSPRAGVFATADDCDLAVSLLARERTPERVVTIAPGLLLGDPGVEVRSARPLTERERSAAAAVAGAVPGVSFDRVLVEGPQWSVSVAPGVLSLGRRDPARAERTAQRLLEDARARADEAAAALLRGDQADDDAPTRGVRVWSPKSRARMRRRLAELDYVAGGFTGAGRVGMVTLTYPGDWLTVAPSAQVCQRHVAKFRQRWERRWGPLVGVWKREFQRRGAPHFHIGCVIPDDPEFLTWLSVTWADVVAHPDLDQRRAHRAAGTGVDFQRGGAAVDPARFADYFAKHGVLSAKEYQNEPPAEWGEDESVGRFWGYWRLDRLVRSVDVAPDVAQVLARTARRHFAATSPRMRVTRWRKVTTVDRETGEVGFKWRKRRTTVPVRRFTRTAGFLVTPDAPGLLVALSRAADGLSRPRGVPAGRVGRSGLGPVGFLP